MLQNDKQFYLVGIGASAGGLEAIEAFFSNIPVNTGLAFVIIQHLSPDYKSLMPEILSKRTPMKVLTAEDGMLVEPNHIYLIPRKKFLKVYQSKLYLTDKDSTIVLNLPIDIFFNSLADDFGEKAIGIILSGTGSDGSRGIRAIKEEGGLILVQNLESSKFDGMPRSAISTGVVDFILPPEEMGEKLINFIQHPYTSKEKSKEIFKDEEDYLTKTIILLKEKFGLDFAFYKNSTIVRRLERRLSINQIDNLRDYYEYLFTSTNEQKVLYKELLIGVTRFFRDTEAFEVLENEVIPKIFEAKTKKEEVRIWIAGCSTGEEAYSVAIAIKEYMNKHSYYNDVKIFATDVDKSAIEYASSGIYSASITADVTRERLEKFFSQIGDSYKINNIIREMIVFATHNLINDPPFNKLDLITCRNLLIYFQPALQQKVMNLFHFSLNSEGFLFLGSSESINELHHLFEIYNHKWRFYKCQEGKKSLKNLDSNLSSSIKITRKDSRKNLSLADKKDELLHLYTQKLLADHVPETIMVNENLEVVNVYGNVNLYLNFPSGRSLSNRLELNI
ncbi:MAG: hypothetical protein KDK45_18740, partial [Leptospiraceae bacterium]|nr:hypothetical protein [Leptospiraceae bacterium]